MRDAILQTSGLPDRLRAAQDTPEGASTITRGGWTDLLFCGIATESCVLKSAVDAFEQHYTPWIVTDASGSNAGEPAHQAGLFVAGRFVGSGQLITTAALLDRATDASASR
jgi:nicotinamidase-related amidase